MTLHKKDGMWISDWNVSDGADDQGCWKRQKEQDRKARAMVAKLKTQGWKRIPEKKVNNTLMFIIGSAELLTAMKKYNADVKKKWANKKVSVSIPGRPKKTDPAWRYHSFFPYEKSLESGLKEWFSDDYQSFDSYWIGELGGYGALMNKGNQYLLIMTGGSDDDEAAHWSTPVFQLALKGQSKLAKTVKKTTTKAKTGRKAPKTMTKSQAKKKFIALLKPYWIKEITALFVLACDSDHSPTQERDKKIYNEWLKIAKSGKIEQAPKMGDTYVQEQAPRSFDFLQNYDTDDYEVWEYIVESWDYTTLIPKSIKKQCAALLPFIEGKVTVKPKAKKTTTRKSKAKPKTGRKAPTISATKRKIGTRMRGNDGNMWQVKKSGKSQRWMAGAESFGAETFEAPRRKRLDFDWIGEDSSDKEWARSGSNTIAAATKKAKAEGWKLVWSQYWGDNAATRKSRMRREAKVWNLMSKSPQWKPWLKFLTERNADNEMSETMDIFRGKAYWKDKNRNSVSILGTTQDYGPWIYDEDRIYVPDHFGEDGGHQVLVKGNQALLLYYIADYDGPVSTPLMIKTFNLSPVKATKTTKKTTTRKSKPKAKPKTKYIVGRKDRPTDLKKRKSPPYSAKQFPKGARKKGNNGKMWTIVTDKRGVKRWKA